MERVSERFSGKAEKTCRWAGENLLVKGKGSSVKTKRLVGGIGLHNLTGKTWVLGMDFIDHFETQLFPMSLIAILWKVRNI